jgi:hypothetical protein
LIYLFMCYEYMCQIQKDNIYIQESVRVPGAEVFALHEVGLWRPMDHQQVGTFPQDFGFSKCSNPPVPSVRQPASVDEIDGAVKTCFAQ